MYSNTILVTVQPSLQFLHAGRIRIQIQYLLLFNSVAMRILWSCSCIQIQYLLLFNLPDILHIPNTVSNSNTILVTVQRKCLSLESTLPEFKYNTCYCSTRIAAEQQKRGIIQIQYLLLFNGIVQCSGRNH